MFDTNVVVGFGVNLPLWTLTLEVTFYIVLPLIAAWYFRRPLVGLLIAALIAIVWRELFANLGDVLAAFGFHPSPERLGQLRFASDNQLPHWAFSFAAGMTSAWAYVWLHDRRERVEIERVAAPAAAAALATLAIFVYAAGRYAIDNPAPFPAAIARQSPVIAIGYTAALSALMLSLSLCRPRLQWPFAQPAVRRLGDISYGVYLIHAVVLWVLSIEFDLPTGGTLWAFTVWAVLVIPVSLLYGYCSARFLEQPVRRWARRYGRRAQTTAAAPLPP
jgi:peptidoglycan/LPS O-acetylase OafA/YrhL